MKPTYACGVDIGGSHITAAIIALNPPKIIHASIRRNKIDEFASIESIINGWGTVIKQSLATVHQPIVNIGIAMPGPFNYGDGICYIKNQHKYEALYNVNVKNLLAEELGQPADSITFANDAACFLQGEVAGGVAVGRTNVIGITLGTGLGSAWFCNGLATDADLWQSPFLEGIAEEYLSSRWFVNRYHQLSLKTVKNVKELTEMYTVDEHVRNVFDEFGANLAAFINQTIAGKDVEMIVLGGNISQSLNLFRNSFSNCFTGYEKIPVQKSILGEHAALLGAVSFNSVPAML